MTDAIAQRLTLVIESNSTLDARQRQEITDLYRIHWKGLCRYVRAHFGPGPPEPEDVAQTAFAKYATASTQRIENPQAFLYATARHLVIDHHRHAQRERAGESSAPDDSVYELSPENVLLQAERFEVLAEALERLPAQRRRLVLLNRFEGLSYVQIGRMFGMSPENVRKHIERALAECLRTLEEAQRSRLRRWSGK